MANRVHKGDSWGKLEVVEVEEREFWTNPDSTIGKGANWWDFIALLRCECGNNYEKPADEINRKKERDCGCGIAAKTTAKQVRAGGDPAGDRGIAVIGEEGVIGGSSANYIPRLGRPMLGRSRRVPMSVTLPEDLIRRLDVEAYDQRKTFSRLVADWLEAAEAAKAWMEENGVEAEWLAAMKGKKAEGG